MGKLLVYLVIASVLCKLVARQWPWELAGWDLKRIFGGSADENRARALLGVSARADRTEILEAHKRLIMVVHPDRGGSADQVHEANAARDLLLARLGKALD